MKYLAIYSFLIFLTASNTMAYEAAFERTKNGIIEVKKIPAGKLIATTGKGSYFDDSNNLFGPLFSYIQSKKISMTVPVEAKIDPGIMYFWIARAEHSKANEPTDLIEIINVKERRVAAIGGKGAYRESEFTNSKKKLLHWLQQQEKWETIGEPYAIYWDGPFKPWFMKNYEVQVEIALRS